MLGCQADQQVALKSNVKLHSQTFVLIRERLGCNCTTHSGLPISQLLFSQPPMMDPLGLAVPLSQHWHLKWQLDASAKVFTEDKSM